MSEQVHTDGGTELPVDPPAGVPAADERDGRRPNVSGDLPSMFEAAPMFRRTVAGYDRFQVDTYVQWAEGELATADREREHLLARHLRTEADLEQARQLLSHSAAGGEFLKVSPRIASLLAAAADEAENIRAEAENHRFVAHAQAELMAARAEQARADAEAEAGRLVAEATTDVQQMTAAAGRIVAEAEQARVDAAAQAAELLAEVRATELRAAERIEQIERQAEADVLAARLQARDEAVRMLATARGERRRADDEAAAIRERLDREAVARRAHLLEDVADLELRRAALRLELARATDRVGASAAPRPLLREYLGRLRLHGHVAAAPSSSTPSQSTPGRVRTDA